MKALSLTQPHANRMASGEKTIETRKWKTNYRGPLLICATKQKVKDEAGEIIEPRGLALCIVDVIGCRPMTKDDEKAACFELYDGAWAWETNNLRTVEPFAVKGQLNIFNVEYDETIKGENVAKDKTKPVRNKAEEQHLRAQAEQDTVTEAYEELLARVMDAKAVAENPASVTWFMGYKNRVDDAVAAFKEASKLKSDCIETEDNIKAHMDAATKLKAAVKEMASYTIHYRVVCGDLSNFLAKHSLFVESLPRSAAWNQTNGLIDIIQNKQS